MCTHQSETEIRNHRNFFIITLSWEHDRFSGNWLRVVEASFSALIRGLEESLVENSFNAQGSVDSIVIIDG